jgi:hypothetical protein
MREITAGELSKILKEHERWFATGKKEGKKADLSHANLSRANLSRANLRFANLSESYLFESNLSNADLFGANLRESNMSCTDLSGADLSEADLSNANLRGANLTRVRGLSTEQISVVKTLYDAKLSLERMKQVRKKYPHLLGEIGLEEEVYEEVEVLEEEGHEEEPEEDMCCPKCGKEQEEGAKFCTSCGVALSSETTQQTTPPEYQGVGQTGLRGWETRCFPCTTEKFHGLPADLNNWLISQNFNCQQFTTEDGGTLLQVAKKGGWRKFVGQSTALNIVLSQRPNHIIVEIGAGRWYDKAIGTVVLGLLLAAPIVGFGAWQQKKLPKKIYQFISEICNNY